MKRIEMPSESMLMAMIMGSSAWTGTDWRKGFNDAIAYANEQLAQADQPVEPWKPVEGQTVAVWRGKNGMQGYGILQPIKTGQTGRTYYLIQDHTTYFDHCAALDSIDEIGKPPQYFINRDGRHI